MIELKLGFQNYTEFQAFIQQLTGTNVVSSPAPAPAPAPKQPTQEEIVILDPSPRKGKVRERYDLRNPSAYSKKTLGAMKLAVSGRSFKNADTGEYTLNKVRQMFTSGWTVVDTHGDEWQIVRHEDMTVDAGYAKGRRPVIYTSVKKGEPLPVQQVYHSTNYVGGNGKVVHRLMCDQMLDSLVKKEELDGALK